MLFEEDLAFFDEVDFQLLLADLLELFFEPILELIFEDMLFAGALFAVDRLLEELLPNVR